VKHNIIQKTLEVHQIRGVEGSFFRSILDAVTACNAVYPNSVKFVAVAPTVRELSFDVEISIGDIGEETQALRVLRTRLGFVSVDE